MTTSLLQNAVVISVISLTFAMAAHARICDADGDGDIDINDIQSISAARGTTAGPQDARDADGDGVITVLDVRRCVTMCTLPRCVEPPPAPHLQFTFDTTVTSSTTVDAGGGQGGLDVPAGAVFNVAVPAGAFTKPV